MRILAPILLGSALAATGCGDDGHDHNHGDVSCMGDEDIQGDTLAGTNMNVVLTTVPDPVDPEANLDFTIAVTDSADAPLDNITVAAEPWQPVHDHGVPIEPEVTAGASAGEYDLSNVYFLHPGRWELRFMLDDGTNMETITAFICVAGTPPSS